jgi:2-dehydropantoate 2-reductase
MDVVVIGAGALGTILAAHLSAAGHQVTVLARGRRADQVAQHGLIVRGLVELNAECNVLDDPAAIADANLLIVTVKTYDNDAAIASLPPCRFDSVFSVANGVLKNAQLTGRFGTDAVLGCMANTSGELLDDGKVRFTRNVCLHLGELNGGVSSRSNAIARTIDDCGVTAAAEEDIRVVEWSKFVGWTALLSLSVSTRFTTAKLLADPHCALLATRMMAEMAKIAVAHGIKIIDQSPLPVASIVAGPIEDGRDIVMTIGNEWTKSAPEHRMSSLQDLERGKRLEVEETLGYALAEAKRLAIETPTLETFYELVTGINAALT